MSGRQVLGAVERAVYGAVLAEGGRVWFRDVLPGDAPAVLRLLEVGLLVHHTEDGTLTAVNPRSVVDRRGAELHSESRVLLDAAELVPASLEGLVQAYDAAPRQAEGVGGVEYVREKEAIRSRLLQSELALRDEVLLAQPGGARPVEQLREMQGRTFGYLERGLTMQLLYQPAAREDGPTVDYAASLVERGARIRVLDEPFVRLLVFDRRTAVIPAAADHTAAAFVEDPAVVNVLLGVFERDWERAERVQWSELGRSGVELPVHEQVGRLLAQGHTQKAVASRLRLSERTVAGHIARLRELHDAETLFQLGWQMRGRGAGVD
ncbi:LuxR family transcriptional regulator [Kitasatospora sp. NPDC096147]|uniref:LuxR family transcriptional regulator n=1 Tax=Kitasatospora sp. NPDC096147 TaxID=3364093 RepID=UPI00382A5F41